MRELLEDLWDFVEDHRGKFFTAILCGLAAAILVVANFFHDTLSSKGCSAGFSIGRVFFIGVVAIFIVFVMWVLGGILVYGSLHVPKALGRWLKERRDPKEIARRRRWRKEHPLWPRIAAFFQRNWKRIAAIPLILALAGLLSYLIGYIAWMAYC